MKPLVGPKFYAFQLAPSGYGSLGGIKINYKTEVVSDEYEPIPGLYGAGTDVCTIYGDSYVFILPGNSMGFALNSGRMAGENAVAFLQGLFSEEEE
jgi:fumarate reductase flavoprotein subunit